jgi:hypothetical protein
MDVRAQRSELNVQACIVLDRSGGRAKRLRRRFDIDAHQLLTRPATSSDQSHGKDQSQAQAPANSGFHQVKHFIFQSKEGVNLLEERAKINSYLGAVPIVSRLGF